MPGRSEQGSIDRASEAAVRAAVFFVVRPLRTHGEPNGRKGRVSCFVTRETIKAVLPARAARASSCRPSHALRLPTWGEMQPSSQTHGRDITSSMFSPLFLRTARIPGSLSSCYAGRGGKKRLKGFSTSSRRGTFCFAHQGNFSHCTNIQHALYMSSCAPHTATTPRSQRDRPFPPGCRPASCYGPRSCCCSPMVIPEMPSSANSTPPHLPSPTGRSASSNTDSTACKPTIPANRPRSCPRRRAQIFAATRRQPPDGSPHWSCRKPAVTGFVSDPEGKPVISEAYRISRDGRGRSNRFRCRELPLPRWRGALRASKSAR